ncbi:lipase [Vibrio pectenicida]|uniref:Lipase n=1 Tax=Vibrio pectenicida TaxID=62763 RepID=A0A7Y3ZX25_9VIBR|nr:lipase [Vibrio pectenicida]NOH70650.1 lipase [Vibrio pectenicida]
MTNLKNIFRLTLLCSAAILVGCGDGKGSSGTEPESYIGESLSRSTTVRMYLDGGNKHVPLNNNLLFDNQTGMLKVLSDKERTNSDISDPKVALGYADGFSTSMPIYISVDGRGFGDYSEITEGVSLFKVTKPLTNNAVFHERPQKLANDEFQVFGRGDKLVVVPTKPFEPSSEYVLVLTNQIKDVKDEPIGMSGSYAGLKSHTYIQGKLAQVQKLIKAQEAIAQVGGIDPKTIVYSSWFTTGSVGYVMTKTAEELLKLKTDSAGAFKLENANPSNLDLSSIYSLALDKDEHGEAKTRSFTAALDDEKVFSVAGSDGEKFKNGLKDLYTASLKNLDLVRVTKGKVTLPYFLESGSAFAVTPFEPAVPGASFVSRYTPIPVIKSLKDVEFTLFTPKDTKVDGIVIYQHGITSVKEDVYAFAVNLTERNLAVIAIDHPLHGARALTLGDNQLIVTDKENPLYYLNLAALPVARDNLRQSVLDILGLRLALEGKYLNVQNDKVELEVYDPDLGVPADVTALDKTNIKFLGHSLGGILGNTAVAIGSATELPQYGFKSAAFAKSGGHIVELLSISGKFGDVIKKSFAAKLGLPVDSQEFETKFAQFKIVAQTLMDTVDPHTVVSAGLYPTNVPTLLLQVKNDDTVPNHGFALIDGNAIPRVPTAHFVGTEGLRSGFEQGDTGVVRQFASFKEGDHASLFVPNTEDSDSEADKQRKTGNTFAIRKLVVDFLSNDSDIPIVNEGVVTLESLSVLE